MTRFTENGLSLAQFPGTLLLHFKLDVRRPFGYSHPRRSSAFTGYVLLRTRRPRPPDDRRKSRLISVAHGLKGFAATHGPQRRRGYSKPASEGPVHVGGIRKTGDVRCLRERSSFLNRTRRTLDPQPCEVGTQ